MKKERVPFISLGSVLLLCVIASQAGAQSFDLRKVVDFDTPIPGGSGNFTYFGPPAISGGNVAFMGAGSSGQSGIYIFNGTTLTKIVDGNTPIPGGSGNFTSLGSPAISGGNVAFIGEGSSGQAGIYLFNGTTLTKVVDFDTPIPDGSGNFIHLHMPLISGNYIAFGGSGASGTSGIYLFNGIALSKVADTNTPIPDGTGNFYGFFVDFLALSGSNVVFLGGGQSSSEIGIYVFSGSVLRKVADPNTLIPDGSGNFTLFNIFTAPGISGGNVAFMGEGSSGQAGNYLFNGIVLSKVVDLNTPIPGGSGNFINLQRPAISGNYIAFGGQGALGERGIYLFNGIVLSKVTDTNTPIPDGSENFFAFGSTVISGNYLAFLGFPASGQSGIYIFNGKTLTKVVDSNTPIPGGSGNFTGFTYLVISGGNVAFLGYDGSGQSGNYLASLPIPQAVSAPTMTQWGITMMSVLLGVSAIYLMRKKGTV